MNSSTHDHDFYAWTQEQVNLLKTGQLDQVDWQNIAQEIEDMGRSEKRQLEGALCAFSGRGALSAPKKVLLWTLEKYPRLQTGEASLIV